MWQTIGQPRAVDLLHKGLQQDRLSHAYIFAGPFHVGKMTLALDLAQALNCTAETERRPCGECLACQKIAAGRHPDVQTASLQIKPNPDETKQRTEIGIDEIGEMLHSASLPPFEGRCRVYIVDEAAHLSQEAANRLLKTLEEPALQVKFVLLTESLRRVPATVISRCQKVTLSRVQPAVIESYLTRYYQAEAEKAKLIGRLSAGCPGWAITALRDPHILEQRQEVFQHLLKAMRSDYSVRLTLAAQWAQQFGKKRETVYETLATWVSAWRDLLLVKAGCADSVVNFDFRAGVAEMARAFGLAEIGQAVKLVQEADSQLRLNASARLVLENLMLSLPLPAAAAKA